MFWQIRKWLFGTFFLKKLGVYYCFLLLLFMQHRTARGSFDAAEPLAADKVPFDWRLFRLHGDHLACTVGTQLRGILALDGGDARGELAGIGHPHVISDDVRALT